MKKKKTPKKEETKPEQYLEQLQRLQAEFVNYRARVEKEKVQLISNSKETIMVKFLDIKDNFDRAPKLDQGMEMVYKQFLKIFQDEGITTIENKEFDPTFHEAIATDVRSEKDKIVDIVQNGYMIKDKVLRPAKVVVGTKEENKNE